LGEVLRKRIGDLGRNPQSQLEAAAIPGRGTHALEATERHDSRAVRKFLPVSAPGSDSCLAIRDHAPAAVLDEVTFGAARQRFGAWCTGASHARFASDADGAR
jgi:hypothetical protein